MDLGWTPYLNGLWIFPLLCLVFMAIMMIGCRGMSSRCCHRSQSTERSDPAGKTPEH